MASDNTQQIMNSLMDVPSWDLAHINNEKEKLESTTDYALIHSLFGEEILRKPRGSSTTVVIPGSINHNAIARLGSKYEGSGEFSKTIQAPVREYSPIIMTLQQKYSRDDYGHMLDSIYQYNHDDMVATDIKSYINLKSHVLVQYFLNSVRRSVLELIYTNKATGSNGEVLIDLDTPASQLNQTYAIGLGIHNIINDIWIKSQSTTQSSNMALVMGHTAYSRLNEETIGDKQVIDDTASDEDRKRGIIGYLPKIGNGFRIPIFSAPFSDFTHYNSDTVVPGEFPADGFALIPYNNNKIYYSTPISAIIKSDKKCYYTTYQESLGTVLVELLSGYIPTISDPETIVTGIITA